MRVSETKVTFGIIIGTRGFFNPKLAQESRKQLLATLDKRGYSHVILPETATAHGAIETLADAKKCADLFQGHRDSIDGIIVVLPNFGDELGIVQTLDRAKLNVPVLIQACSDKLDAVDVSGRRDAFCGKLSVCNNLYQYGIPFTDTRDHTCEIDSDAFVADLDFFAAVCRVVKGLRHARVGAIGARPAAFQTVRFSEKLLQDSGITVVPVDLSEIIGRAKQLDGEATAVKKRLSEIEAYGTIPSRIDDQNVLKQARLSVVAVS